MFKSRKKKRKEKLKKNIKQILNEEESILEEKIQDIMKKLKVFEIQNDINSSDSELILIDENKFVEDNFNEKKYISLNHQILTNEKKEYKIYLGQKGLEIKYDFDNEVFHIYNLNNNEIYIVQNYEIIGILKEKIIKFFQN